MAEAIADWFFDRSGFGEIEHNAFQQRCLPPNPIPNHHKICLAPHMDIDL